MTALLMAFTAIGLCIAADLYEAKGLAVLGGFLVGLMVRHAERFLAMALKP